MTYTIPVPRETLQDAMHGLDTCTGSKARAAFADIRALLASPPPAVEYVTDYDKPAAQPVAWIKTTPSAVYLRTNEKMQDIPESEDGLDRQGWRALTWQDAPTRTEWGHGMRVATVALGKDATADVFAHEDDLHLVAPALSAATQPVNEPNYDSFGYALAAGVLQSDLYHKLDDKQRAECDELLTRGTGKAQPAEQIAQPQERKS